MKRKVLLGLFLLICFFQGSHSQGTSKYQALFVYNFTRYIEWPSKNSQEFVIGILGKSKVYDELQAISQGKWVGSQSIAVKKVQNVNELTTCNILFVSSEVSSQVSQLASQLQGNNTLIITERSGLTNKGAGISFIIDDGKQKFEINKSNLEKTGLKVNKALLDMAMLTD